MKKTSIFIVLLATIFFVHGTVYANLTVRGVGEIVSGGSGSYKMIYDDCLDITWLDFTHPTPYDSTNMYWESQIDWALGLEVVFNGETFDDWRLPVTNENDVVKSEMGHLYWDSLGNSGDGLQNTGPFDNLQASSSYWSSTQAFPYENESPRFYWAFRFTSGSQYAEYHFDNHPALAVLPGDAAARVPEPTTILLLGLGLIGLAGVRRKLKK